jgi:hypothetical protein
MVIKSAQMGVPIVVSRSGITQMGHEVAQRLGLCAIGRATNRRFVCYAGAERLQLQPELAGPRSCAQRPDPPHTRQGACFAALPTGRRSRLGASGAGRSGKRRVPGRRMGALHMR